MLRRFGDLRDAIFKEGINESEFKRVRLVGLLT